MKLLIVGSSGFVGKHLIQHLQNDFGKELISCDLLNGYDVLRPETFKHLPHIDMVIHLVAKIYVPASFEKPTETYQTNIIGVLNMLEYCRITGVKRFIYISSYVYGQPQYLPIDEKHPLGVHNPYTRSKLIGEILCRGYYEDYGIDIDIIRPFNLYGEGQDPRFVIPSILTQYFSDSRTISVDNLKPKRDYLYIKDFIELLRKICMKKNPGVRVMNAGSGVSHSVKDIIDTLSTIAPKPKKIVDKRKIRKGEIMETVADISFAKKELHWHPNYTLSNGLEEMVKGMI